MSLAMPQHTSISDVLREGRVQLGGGDPTRFPQPRMADLLGVSLRQYQRWERGSSRPSARALERIKQALAQEQARDAVPVLDERVLALVVELRALRAELDALRAQHA
jgi:transcriptional regulator with XRE-family HTH domain